MHWALFAQRRGTGITACHAMWLCMRGQAKLPASSMCPPAVPFLPAVCFSKLVWEAARCAGHRCVCLTLVCPPPVPQPHPLRQRRWLSCSLLQCFNAAAAPRDDPFCYSRTSRPKLAGLQPSSTSASFQLRVTPSSQSHSRWQEASRAELRNPAENGAKRSVTKKDRAVTAWAVFARSALPPAAARLPCLPGSVATNEHFCTLLDDGIDCNLLHSAVQCFAQANVPAPALPRRPTGRNRMVAP